MILVSLCISPCFDFTFTVCSFETLFFCYLCRLGSSHCLRLEYRSKLLLVNLFLKFYRNILILLQLRIQVSITNKILNAFGQC